MEPERFQADDEPFSRHWHDPPAPWPQDPAEDSASRELLGRALSELPAMWRAVVVARDVRGRTADDAARELGIAPEDQIPLLHRARAALRQALAEHYQQTSGSAGPGEAP